jgi:hypothetical protein
MRKNRVTIRTGTSDDFFDRVRGHAKKLAELLVSSRLSAFACYGGPNGIAAHL